MVYLLVQKSALFKVPNTVISKGKYRDNTNIQTIAHNLIHAHTNSSHTYIKIGIYCYCMYRCVGMRASQYVKAGDIKGYFGGDALCTKYIFYFHSFLLTFSTHFTFFLHLRLQLFRSFV